MPKLLADKFHFAPPKDGGCDLLIIAGEHSGDEQAARMLKSALAINPNLKVCAFGGKHLEAAGAQLLYDMTAFSVVGLFEVLKHYSFFKHLSESVLNWIALHNPKAVCFVDYPGFNLHIASLMKLRKLSKKGGGNISTLFYISPQIWAWKAKRRFKMAETLDSLAVIFSFEKDCYKDTSLETVFVGHPFIDPAYKAGVEYDATADILFLPGSRRVAVSRIFPVMLETLRILENEKAKVLYPSDEIKDVLERTISNFTDLKGRITLIKSGAQTVKAKAVLMSSGTMSLTAALAAIPSAIIYKANVFTYFLGRMLVRVKYLGIANILLDGQSMPEFIQFAATPKAIAKHLDYCINNPEAKIHAQNVAEKLKEKLAADSNINAATWLLNRIK